MGHKRDTCYTTGHILYNTVLPCTDPFAKYFIENLNLIVAMGQHPSILATMAVN